MATWTPKTNSDDVAAAHINDLQTGKLDADGAIPMNHLHLGDLTLNDWGFKLQITDDATFGSTLISAIQPNLPDNQLGGIIAFGRGWDQGQTGYIGWRASAITENANYLMLGHYATDHAFYLFQTGQIGLWDFNPSSTVGIRAAGIINAPVFTGVGIDDMVDTGLWNGADVAIVTYTVEIDSVGATDTYRWRKNAGAWTNLVPIAAVDVGQVLMDQVEVWFHSTAGHTMGDLWTITVTPTDPLIIKDIDGSTIFLFSRGGAFSTRTPQFVRAVQINTPAGVLAGGLINYKGSDAGWNGIGIDGLTEINPAATGSVVFGRGYSGVNRIKLGLHATANAAGDFSVQLWGGNYYQGILKGSNGEFFQIYVVNQADVAVDVPIMLQPAAGKVSIGGNIPRSMLNIATLSNYANNAAALIGGLLTGDLYCETGTDPLRVCKVV